MYTPLYHCTQAELIAIANTGWNSYTQHLPSFSSYRGYYDAAYASTAKAAVTAANQLPDAQARYANAEVLRTELVTLADACLARWQTLKRYISTSYPQPAIKPRLEEAGSLRYERAANYNWEELQALNTSALNFMLAQNAALAAGNNMPLAFPAAYSLDTTAYDSKYQAFIDAEEAAYNATEAKIAACNAVYTTLINMFKDGQEIFAQQEGIRREFTFDTVLGLISSPSQAGIRGKVSDAATSLPIEGVTVLVLGSNQSSTTDIDGRYEIKPLAASYYDISFVAPSYHDIVINQHHVLTGTVSTLDMLLDKMQ